MENFVENSIISMPTTDNGPKWIGDLWDCHNSILSGFNLYKDLAKEHLRIDQIEIQGSELLHVRNIKDHQKHLDVSGEISLEILNGLIKVEGSGKYISDDVSNLTEEQLSFNMKLTSQSIQTKTSASQAVDQLVLDKILKGEIKATHIVNRVDIGASLQASLKIKQSSSKATSEAGGSFLGKLLLGPVNASVKVSLGFLDDKSSNDLETQITVKGQPYLGMQPKSIAEMFKAIDNIGELLKDKKPDIFADDKNVYGVPIRYYLVPIKQFVDVKVELMYIKIKDDLLEKLERMFVDLQSLQQPGNILKKIYNKSSNLKIILEDRDNIVTKEIIEKEKTLQADAKQFFTKAVEYFSDYKKQLKTAEEMLHLTNEFNEKFNFYEIEQLVNQFASKCRNELLSISEGKIVAEYPINLFTNKDDMNTWFQKGEKIKLLIKGSNDYAIDHYCSLLYAISQKLSHVDIELGVAIPSANVNATASACCTVKTSSDTKDYCKEDLSNIIRILGLILETESVPVTIYYNIYCSRRNISLPLSDSIQQLNMLIGCLPKNKLAFASNYVELRSTILTAPSDRFTLVISLESASIASECVTVLTTLMTALHDKIKFVVGMFQLRNTQFTTPLAFLFHGEKLVAVCCNNIDVLILKNAFSETEVNQELLDYLKVKSSNVKQNFWSSEVANFAVEVYNIFSVESPRIKFLEDTNVGKSFKATPHKRLLILHNILESCLTKNAEKLANALISNIIFESVEYEAIFKKYSTENELDMIDLVNKQEMENLIKDLESFQQTKFPFLYKLKCVQTLIEDKGAFEIIKKLIEDIVSDKECPDKLKNILETCEERNLELIKHAINTYLIQNSTVVQDMILMLLDILKNRVTSSTYKTILQKIGNITLKHLEENFSEIYQKMGFKNLFQNKQFYDFLFLTEKLAKHSISYIQAENCVRNIHHLDIRSQKQTMKDLANLNLKNEQYKAIFRTNSFRYFFEKAIQDQTFNRFISSLFCHIEDLSFLPSNVVAVLEQYLSQQRLFEEVPEIFKNVDEISKFIMAINDLEQIPPKFVQSLLKTIEVDRTLISKLGINGNNFNYNTEQNIFEDPLTHKTLLVILENIRKLNLPTEDKYILDQNAKDIKSSVTRNVDFQNVYTFPTNLSTMAEELIGKHPDKITEKEYLKLKFLKKPENVNFNENQCVGSYLPYIIQEIKFWCVSILEPFRLDKLLPQISQENKPVRRGRINFGSKNTDQLNTTNTGAVSVKNNSVLSKLDILSSMLVVCHPLVLQDVIRILTNFQIALPLVLPDLTGTIDGNSRKYKSILQYLKQGNIKWESKPGKIVYHQLFVNPFKLILVMRLGNNENCGKSTILNQLLKSKETFSSKSNTGSIRGLPKCLFGSVEILPLIQESVSDSFWEYEVTLSKNGVDEPFSLKHHYTKLNETGSLVVLGNLHGDAAECLDVLSYLKPMISGCILCIMPNVTEIQKKISTLEAILGKDIFGICIDPTNEDIQCDRLFTKSLLDDSSLNVLKDLVLDVISNSSTREMLLPDETPNVTYMATVNSIYAKSLLEIIHVNSCSEVKKALDLHDSQKIQKYKDVGLYLESNPLLYTMMKKYLNMLELPIEERKIALIQLDNETSRLSREETEPTRKRLFELQDQKNRLVGADMQTTYQEKLQIEVEIQKCFHNIEKQSLGVEHFYREMSEIYQHSLNNPKIENNGYILTMASNFADLVEEGFAIEILNGDNGKLHGEWLNRICHSLCNIHKNLRVFVISIIGLQSSGKSTLLNVLFGCKFAVSVGRCTRGLFMRILFLEEDLSKYLGIDAIIIIDTEGLGSQEVQNDTDADKKDRLLATFAMSISDLTLINVAGESTKDITDILQIVLVTMARLDQADIRPDMLMIQHLPLRDASKVANAADVFCKALQEAINFTSKHDLQLGVLNSSSLENVFKTVSDSKYLKQFRPYMKGATANSPPSEQYIEDVKDLYKTIQDKIRASTIQKNENGGSNVKLFCTWHDLLNSFWNEIKQQNLSLKFKNIKLMREHIRVEEQMANVKRAIESAFDEHYLIHEKKINKTLRDLEEKDKSNTEGNTQLVMNSAIQDLSSVPQNCINRCEFCKTALVREEELYNMVDGKYYEHDTKISITTYIRRTKNNVVAKIQQKASVMKVKFDKFKQLESIVQKYVKEYRVDGINETMIEDLVEKIIKQSLVEVSTMKQVPSATKTVIDEIKTTSYVTDPGVTRKIIQNEILADPLINIEAIDLSFWRNAAAGVVNAVKKNTLQNKYLDVAKVQYLENECRKIPYLILKERRAEIFMDGMTSMLKLKVQNMLANFEENELKSNILLPKFKWTVHLTALKYFLEVIQQKEQQWLKDNDPLTVFRSQESKYREDIRILLRNGFGSEAESGMICNHLIKVVNSKAKNIANSKHVSRILTEYWITSTERIRLTYFEELAKQVNENDKSNALEYFSCPTIYFRNWFVNKINSINKEKAEEEYVSTLKSELNNLSREISNTTSIHELIRFIKDFEISELEFVPPYDLKCSVEDIDFNICKSVIQEKLEEKKPEILQSILVLDPPITNKKIKERIGCIESCPLCAGMCWKNFDHEEDEGEMKKHHTCHQPEGLAGIAYRDSHELVEHNCDKWADDHIWWLHDTKTTFREVKRKYSHWLFGSHSKQEFNDLMKWFFMSLHEDIATNRNLKPGNISKFRHLNLNSILTTVNSALTT